MMASLHIEIRFHLDDHGGGMFSAWVTGLTKPNEATEIALRKTGGSWCNQVTWYSDHKAYLVVGIYDNDPNWGDHPAHLDRRLRRIHGDWSVSILITNNDGTVFEEGTLRASELYHHLAVTGQLN